MKMFVSVSFWKVSKHGIGLVDSEQVVLCQPEFNDRYLSMFVIDSI